MMNNRAMSCVIFTLSVLSSLYGMHPEIKEQIDNQQEFLTKELAYYEPNSIEVLNVHMYHHQAIAGIVRASGDRMTKQAKLQYLYGDTRYKKRKKIITSMIEDDGVDPNTIKYQGVSPLRESVFYGDHDFIMYLIEHGSVPDSETIKLNNYTELKIADLILQQNKNN